jgi:membrane-bound ClpP family serine protease
MRKHRVTIGITFILLLIGGFVWLFIDQYKITGMVVMPLVMQAVVLVLIMVFLLALALHISIESDKARRYDCSNNGE